jgi:hypothetical protein
MNVDMNVDIRGYDVDIRGYGRGYANLLVILTRNTLWQPLF